MALGNAELRLLRLMRLILMLRPTVLTGADLAKWARSMAAATAEEGLAVAAAAADEGLAVAAAAAAAEEGLAVAAVTRGKH